MSRPPLRTRAVHPTLPFDAPIWHRTIAEWQEVLTRVLGRPVEVVYGRSRTMPVHASEQGGGGLRVRLHRMFEQAPAEVVEALGGWLRSGRRARRAAKVLDGWIDQGLSRLPARARGPLPTSGRHHDLLAVLLDLCAGELRSDFAEHSPPAVGWSIRRRSRARRSLQLGHYDAETHVVRIHPVLDRADVPVWYVRFLVFHELLHAVYPSRRTASGNWVHHGADFKARERAHPDHRRAQRWESENLPRLIRAARAAESADGSTSGGSS